MRTVTNEQARAVAYHGELAADWEARYRKPAFQARLRVLEECLAGRDLGDQPWLDAGCGAGTIARFLAEKGCQVLGVDASIEMITAARESAINFAVRDRLQFDRVDILAGLPYPAASFEGILCSSVLEYVSDVNACLAEFHRALRPGGLLLVSVPNRRSIIRRAQVNTYRLGNALNQKWLPFLEHSRNEYSAAGFRERLESHGFTVEHSIPFGSPIPRWLQHQEYGGSLLMFCARRKPTP
jgi:2-polyprenyl-6-hydroxyphenyl methylase/3-demethylubiquinone-9 3-methyltransferase